MQQRKAVSGPQSRCYYALRSAGFCQAAPARREDGLAVRKEQQKGVVAEQPVLRAAARRRAGSATHASTPAMATSSSLGQDNAWLQRGKVARSRSSLRHLQPDSGGQEGWGEVSSLQGALPASKFRLVVSLPQKHRRAAGSACVWSHDGSCPPTQRAQEGGWRAQIQGNVGQTRGIPSSY